MRTRTARRAAEHAAGVPPGGFEPPPAIFAESCPVRGTVAGVPTGDRARGGPPGRSQQMESNHLRRGSGRAGALPGLRGIRRGTGWIRTSAHPFNKRPLNLLSFGPKCRCVATPAAVARRAFAAATWSELPARAKSAMTGSIAGPRPTRRAFRRRPDPRCGSPFDVIPADQPGRDFPCCSSRPHVLGRVHVARPVSWSRSTHACRQRRGRAAPCRSAERS